MPSAHFRAAYPANNLWQNRTPYAQGALTDEPIPPDDRTPLVRTNFVISGAFEPDEVTQLMGIAPSSIGRRGSRVRTPAQTIPIADSWWLQTTEEHYNVATASTRPAR